MFVEVILPPPLSGWGYWSAYVFSVNHMAHLSWTSIEAVEHFLSLSLSLLQFHFSKELRTHLKSPLESATAKMVMKIMVHLLSLSLPLSLPPSLSQEQSQLSQLRAALPQAESQHQTLLVTLSVSHY